MIFIFFHQEIDATKSCKTLLQSGHTSPGYYFVDGPGGLNYQLVKCNMNMEPSNAQFQVAASTRLAEYSVAFDCYVDGKFPDGSVLPCSVDILNIGNAMNSNGTFTVPLDGVYFFGISWGRRALLRCNQE